MPKRHSRLYQRTNDGPATLLLSGGITEVTAAFKWQFKRHLREGYRIIDDNNKRFTVKRGNEVVEIWIESDPVQHRAPGGGPKPLAPEEPTVKVAVTLLASQADAAKQLGNGNLSAGLRKALEMTKQSAEQRIREMLKEVYEEGDVNAATIFKGYAHDTFQSGWHLRFFDRSNHIFMGTSVAEVANFCDAVRSLRENDPH